MNSEERILAALNLEMLDRVPLFELGVNPHPLLKLITFWKYIPNSIKHLVRRSGIYHEYIDVLRDEFGMGKNYRVLFRRPLMMKRTSRILFTLPTNWKINYQKLIMYYFPIKILTKYDGIGYPIFPSTKVIGRKGGYLVIESGMTVDIDPRTANIRWRSVAFPPNDENISNKQLQYIYKALDNFDWEFGIKTYKKLRKLGLCMPITFLGIWEIWDSLYGVDHLSKFYYEISREFRKKKGPILDLWDRLENFFIEALERYSEIGVRIAGILDDLVYDEGTFVNPKFYREFLYPHYKNIINKAHKLGMKIFIHTDGKLEPVIKDLIDLGFDGIQSIQADVNNFKNIKENFGDKICLIGGISSKRLELASPNEVYTEAKLKTIIGKINGGYIAGSDNVIHDGVKMENWHAMVNAVLKYGKY
ncbi:MAG: uroporphyrinogen decarboxylase family protein [Candidatus Helarchaeota archaeon]